MAAIIQLRRGSSPSSLSYGEPFINDDSASLVIGLSGSNDIVTLTKLEQKNYGNLWIDGDITASNISASGDIRIGGQLFLGDDAADNIVIEGSLSSSLIPESGSTYNIGSTTKSWNELHISRIFSTTLIVTSSAQISTFGFISGSDLNSLNSYTSSTDERLNGIDSFTSSIQTEVDGISAATSSYLTSSGSVDYIDLTSVPTGILSSSEQITDFGFISESAENTSLNAYTASNDINITNIHSTTSSLEQRVGEIESNTGSYSGGGGTDLTHLNTFTSSIQTEVDGLSSVTSSYLTSSGSVDYSDITSLPTLVSQSGQVNYNGLLNKPSFIGGANVTITSASNGITINSTGGGSGSADLSHLNAFTQSSTNRFTQLSTETGSQNQRLDSLESESGSYLTTLDSGIVSSSAQITAFGFISESGGAGADLTSLNTYTASNDNNITNIHSTTSSLEQRVEQIEINTGSYAGGGTDLTQINTFTSSADQRLDSLESESGSYNTITAFHTFTSSLGTVSTFAVTQSVQDDDTLIPTAKAVSASIAEIDTTNLTSLNSFTASNGNSSLNTFTGSFNTAISINSDDVTILGDLTVQGTKTELTTQTLNVQDKNILIASGASDSAAADGAGITIDGANESLEWNHPNSRFAFSDDLFVSGTVKASDDMVAFSSSDKRLKNNIKPIESALDKVSKISGNTFDWNEEKQNTYKGKDYGVIAQEIEEVMPELVDTRDNGYKAVKYEKIVPLLIESIKELQKEIEELKSK